MALMTLRRAAGAGCQVEDDPINIWPPQTKIFSQLFKSEHDPSIRLFVTSLIKGRFQKVLNPIFFIFLIVLFWRRRKFFCKQFMYGDHIYTSISWLSCNAMMLHENMKVKVKWEYHCLSRGLWKVEAQKQKSNFANSQSLCERDVVPT